MISMPTLFASMALAQDGRIEGTVTGLPAEPIWVYVEGEGPPPDPVATVVRQFGMTFEPSTLVVARGTRVEFLNEGPEWHDVYSASPIALFDLDSYAPGGSRPWTFEEVGVVEVNCNKHASMRLHVLVVPNRWYARVAPNGSFRLTGVSAGPHTVKVWSVNATDAAPSVVVDVPATGAARVQLDWRAR